MFNSDCTRRGVREQRVQSANEPLGSGTARCLGNGKSSILNNQNPQLQYALTRAHYKSVYNFSCKRWRRSIRYLCFRHAIGYYLESPKTHKLCSFKRILKCNNPFLMIFKCTSKGIKEIESIFLIGWTFRH